MSCTIQPKHPQEFYAPGWHYETQTPIVDGKYHDRTTGEVRILSKDDSVSGGPPEVDIIVMNLHEDSNEGICRAARPFPVEVLLCEIMRVVHDRKLKLDSLNATAYAIRVVLAHELTKDEFNDVANKMTNGVWDQV